MCVKALHSSRNVISLVVFVSAVRLNNSVVLHYQAFLSCSTRMGCLLYSLSTLRSRVPRTEP